MTRPTDPSDPTMDTGMGGVDGSVDLDPRSAPGATSGSMQLPNDPAGQGPMMRRGIRRIPGQHSPKSEDYRPEGTSRDPTVGSFAAFTQHQLVNVMLEIIGNGTAAKRLTDVPDEATVRSMSTGELKELLQRCKIDGPSQVPRRPKFS